MQEATHPYVLKAYTSVKINNKSAVDSSVRDELLAH